MSPLEKRLIWAIVKVVFATAMFVAEVIWAVWITVTVLNLQGAVL